MYQIDTDILSYAVRGDAHVLRAFRDAGESPCFVSTLTLYELAFGIERSPRRVTLRRGFEAVRDLIIALPVCEAVAAEAARVRAQGESRGMVVGAVDPVIAGTALVHDLTLVTHNTKHFAHVDGLRLADWKRAEP